MKRILYCDLVGQTLNGLGKKFGAVAINPVEMGWARRCLRFEVDEDMTTEVGTGQFYVGENARVNFELIEEETM